MAIQKEHKEFYRPDPGKGWETPAGYPKGIEQQILAGALDEKAKRGHRSCVLCALWLNCRLQVSSVKAIFDVYRY